MEDPSEEWIDGDGIPMLVGRHLIVTRSIWYDPKFPERGFSLGGVVTRMDVSEDELPLRLSRLFVYAQLWGDDAEYRFRVRLVRIGIDDDGEPVEIQVGPNGVPVEYPMPGERSVEVSSLVFVQEVAYALTNLVFESAGTYEFQLFADDREEPVAAERMEIRS